MGLVHSSCLAPCRAQAGLLSPHFKDRGMRSPHWPPPARIPSSARNCVPAPSLLLRLECYACCPW